MAGKGRARERAATKPHLDTTLCGFQNSLVSSEKFESMSDADLLAYADKMGLDLPQGLDRVFIIEELVDALAEDSQDSRITGTSLKFEAARFSGPEFDELEAHAGEEDAPGRLEQRYNQTEIRVIIRDPSWAFAFWDISEADRDKLRGEDNTITLFLRVAELQPSSDGHREFFDIAVSQDDLQWYINFPNPEAGYRVDLCARDGAHPRLLARSAEIRLPREILPRARNEFEPDIAELLRLSGSGRLDIEPKEEENPQRILKSCAE